MGFISILLDILFPPKCVFCSRILNKSDEGWCDDCTESLPYADNGGKQDGDVFDFCVSPLYYRGVVRKSILRYKFRNAPGYAVIYGKLLADCIRESPDMDYDIITWVPLSEKHLRSRGYDQALLLASSTAAELGDITTDTLRKPRDIKAQSELGDREERSANIKGAYIIPDPETVNGKSILLIDDIITTGSTLSECARVLLSAGAKRVVCATLARTE